MASKKTPGTHVPGLDPEKPDAMSNEEWAWWKDDEWDAIDTGEKRRAGFLDESFAKANEASVMQWSDKSQSYEKVNVKDMGKNKKAKAAIYDRLKSDPKPSGFVQTNAWGGASSTVSTLSAEPKCSHEGITPVLTIPTGTQFYAASSTYAREASYLCDMAIDVGASITDSLTSKPFVEPKGVCSDATLDAIKSLNAHTLRLPPIIRLDWPDMGIPPAGLAFWRALVAILPPHGKVVVACIGSHGRTGTTLASLCIVTMGMTARQAIDHIRHVHCKKAIESMAQEKYLQSLSDAMEADRPRQPATR